MLYENGQVFVGGIEVIPERYIQQATGIIHAYHNNMYLPVLFVGLGVSIHYAERIE